MKDFVKGVDIMKTAQQIRDNLANVSMLASIEQKRKQEQALKQFKVMFDKATEKMFSDGLLEYHILDWNYTPMQTKNFGISDYIREHGFEYKWNKSCEFVGRRLCIIVPQK